MKRTIFALLIMAAMLLLSAGALADDMGDLVYPFQYARSRRVYSRDWRRHR